MEDDKILELMRLSCGSTFAEYIRGLLDWKYKLFLPKTYWEPIVQRLMSVEVLHEIYPFYTNHYTEEEIDRLIEFYRSPDGEKLTKLSPELMVKFVALTNKWIDRVMGKLTKDGHITNFMESFEGDDIEVDLLPTDEWAKVNFQKKIKSTKADNDRLSISLPLYKEDGKAYEIFLKLVDHEFILSDEGATYAELDKIFELGEPDVIKNLVAILKHYGCKKDKETNAFYTISEISNIHIKMSNLIQAISFMLNMKIFYI